MDKNEALEILGFSENANPQQWELEERYKEKLCPTFSQNKSLQERLKQYKKLKTAFNFLSEQFYGPAPQPYNDVDLDNPSINLQSVLFSAINSEDVKLLKKVFSKFKNGKGGQFGDYINQPYIKTNALSYAALLGNIEIVELLLKNGADPNTEIDGFWRNDKIKKLLIEYGRIDKSSVFCQLALAVLTSYVAFAIYSSCDASFLCYAGVAAFALAAVLLVTNAVQAAFFAKTKNLLLILMKLMLSKQ